MNMFIQILLYILWGIVGFSWGMLWSYRQFRKVMDLLQETVGLWGKTIVSLKKATDRIRELEEEKKFLKKINQDTKGKTITKSPKR